MSKKKKIFVWDTNVPLHDCRCFSSFEEHDIAIPIDVLTEIDRFKSGDDPVHYNAREFIRFLDSLPEEKIFDGGASLGRGLGKLRVIVGLPYHEKVQHIYPEHSSDNMILNVAYQLHFDSLQNKGKEVVLVSKDVNLRMRAKSLGVKAEDYKTDTVVNVASLYKEAKILTVSAATVSKLYSDGEVPVKENYCENEFFILNGDTGEEKKSSALAIFKNKKFHLVSKEKASAFGVRPKNSEQAFALTALLDPEISLVTIIGKAGTGKTIISLAAGLNQLDKGAFENLFFTRQTMDLGGHGIGFLPGDVGEKLHPYMQALWDNLAVVSTVSKNESSKIKKFKEDGKIVVEPLNSIRGRSLVKKFFIIDEVQNLTPQEVKAIVTRAGEGTKIVLIGDISQNDNPRLDERSNGLSYTIDKMRGQSFYAHVVLKKGERSKLAEIAGELL